MRFLFRMIATRFFFWKAEKENVITTLIKMYYTYKTLKIIQNTVMLVVQFDKILSILHVLKCRFHLEYGLAGFLCEYILA